MGMTTNKAAMGVVVNRRWMDAIELDPIDGDWTREQTAYGWTGEDDVLIWVCQKCASLAKWTWCAEQRMALIHQKTNKT